MRQMNFRFSVSDLSLCCSKIYIYTFTVSTDSKSSAEEPTAVFLVISFSISYVLCAELPQQIRHPSHSEHPLKLLNELPEYYSTCICHACGQRDWNNFFYRCSLCAFSLDVSCTTADQGFETELTDRTCKFKSHEHTMILQQSQATVCDACQVGKKDASYMWSTCPFWIHKNCASLPDLVYHEGHKHTLELAYSLPSEHHSFILKCTVCHCKICRNLWSYYCSPCRFLVHVNCGKVTNDPILYGESDLEDPEIHCNQNLVKLPMVQAAQKLINNCLLRGNGSNTSSGTSKSMKFRMRFKICVFLHEDNEKEKGKKVLFRSQTIPKSLTEAGMKRNQNEKEMEETIVHRSHKHPLLLFNRVPTSTGADIGEGMLPQRDGYVDPISFTDLCYRCVDCGFFLHAACGKIPHELQMAMHPEHPVILTTRRNFVGYFRCDACQQPGNGFHYTCKPCNFDICIKCASARMCQIIFHNAHKRHILTQIASWKPIGCNGCGYLKARGFAFGCEECQFFLDYKCALLPPTTKR